MSRSKEIFVLLAAGVRREEKPRMIQGIAFIIASFG